MKFNFEFTLKRKSGNVGVNKGNELINSNDRPHYAVRSTIVKFLRELSHDTFVEDHGGLSDSLPMFDIDRPCRVIISVDAPTRRKMDTPNWYPTIKALLDGLTDANLWSDDDDSIIHELIFKTSNKLSPVKGSYKFNIDIQPIK